MLQVLPPFVVGFIQTALERSEIALCLLDVECNKDRAS